MIEIGRLLQERKMRRMSAQSRPGHADAKRFAVRKSRGEMKPVSKEFDSLSNQNWLWSSTKAASFLPMSTDEIYGTAL